MSKIDEIIVVLSADWVSVPVLMEKTGWNNTTIRGALSAAAKKRNLRIERKRENGVTSYRVANV